MKEVFAIAFFLQLDSSLLLHCFSTFLNVALPSPNLEGLPNLLGFFHKGLVDERSLCNCIFLQLDSSLLLHCFSTFLNVALPSPNLEGLPNLLGFFHKGLVDERSLCNCSLFANPYSLLPQ